MTYAVPAPVQRSLTIAGSGARFPVNRIFCVGRNYAAHAREMGRDPDREAPFFFMKPAQAAVDAAGPVTIPYPPRTKNFHHEIELVVAIAKGGADIKVENALDHVYGYAVGLDMTRRDLQLDARDKGRPWEFGKSFAASAPIGAIARAADIGHPENAAIALTVNGQPRQASDIDKLIWSVAESIAQLSMYEALEPGDLIMTGTPEGVNPVLPGDLMLGTIAGLAGIDVRVAK
ncbi:fumarylacetoacetate hydrolase family protein [Nevskia ramosa]|uniref:fumarylacetoacetate hydrolase family protein n=1 Tax=Nevskia ramosa TaxID=64002 RepID=UPI003D0E0D4A